MTPEPTPPFDYRGELLRTRRAQGLPDELPQDIRDAVAALLTRTEWDVP
jgi:hypothetical protein